MLELGFAGVEEEASVEEKDGSVPLYKGCEYETSPPRPQDFPIPKELYPSDGWVTHVQVDKNPLKRGDMISAWIRHANRTTSQNVGRQASQRVENNVRAGVVS